MELQSPHNYESRSSLKKSDNNKNFEFPQIQIQEFNENLENDNEEENQFAIQNEGNQKQQNQKGTQKDNNYSQDKYIKDFQNFLMDKQNKMKQVDDFNQLFRLEEKEKEQRAENDNYQLQLAERSNKRVFELQKRLKLKHKSKEQRFNETLNNFKQTSTFVDIKNFLKDMNALNYSKYRNKLKILKESIEQKQKESEQFGGAVYAMDSLNSAQDGQILQFSPNFGLLNSATKKLVNWKKTRQSGFEFLTQDLVKYLKSIQSSQHDNVGDPQSDNMIFFENLRDFLFNDNISGNKQNGQFLIDNQSFTPLNMLENIEELLQQVAIKEKEYEEKKLEETKENLNKQIITTEGIDNDIDPTSEAYYKQYKQKVERIRNTLMKIQQRCFKEKWANSQMKLKMAKMQDHQKILGQINHPRTQNFNKLLFPSLKTQNMVLNGKQIDPKINDGKGNKFIGNRQNTIQYQQTEVNSNNIQKNSINMHQQVASVINQRSNNSHRDYSNNPNSNSHRQSSEKFLLTEPDFQTPNSHFYSSKVKQDKDQKSPEVFNLNSCNENSNNHNQVIQNNNFPSTTKSVANLITNNHEPMPIRNSFYKSNFTPNRMSLSMVNFQGRMSTKLNAIDHEFQQKHQLAKQMQDLLNNIDNNHTNYKADKKNYIKEIETIQKNYDEDIKKYKPMQLESLRFLSEKDNNNQNIQQKKQLIIRPKQLRKAFANGV